MSTSASHEVSDLDLDLDQSSTLKSAETERMPVVTLDESLIAERYQVIEKLGSGGMSTVYKVNHVHLNKILALKLLQQVSESSVQRFQLEAKAATLLEHPNIVRVHDFGITEGQPYMIMDYIEGESLAEILKKDGSLPISRLSRMFGQICGALAHAHEQGVVHRDIKPSNIIIKASDSAAEQPIVADFGIAKIMEVADTASKHNLTRTGELFGTPLYMSPEQSQGQKVDARSDIYSLACVMYEAATGEQPFQGESIYQIIHKQITEAPPPFPDRLRKTAAGRRLEALILKALAKAPADRQKYMLELSSELKAIELGDGGLWSDLKSFSSIVSGRLKATERKNIIVRVSLQSTALVACLLSVLLFILPGEIRTTQQQLERNEQIISTVQALLNFSKTEDFFTTDKVVPKAKRIKELCQSDPQQKAAFRNMLISMKQASAKTSQVKKTIMNNLSAEGMSLEALTMLQNNLFDLVTCWSDTFLKGEKLTSYAAEKIVKGKQNLQLMNALFNLSFFVALICEVLLLILLANSGAQSRKPAAEGKSSS